ncbi:bifunctional indole-3-glycerol-phosphate synthase TrpC/phosphoribosylanthranilate isomerase TrpF [Persicimonas caeni]|uniref:N-(5'-phosphoribosyl)anthranilate isomerase n=1 Tax=Persicimonas caeni TaxID=2292766 RepID=A0A4Y6PWF4_PERCE|nr:bifunctional indole-3-glycerol-phosphate synthase TrpC/phosphoribosylanthranilate isomerase TrpF [Persicimonas caeni]QDG52664.1 bifunctional indole-3-glycerol-phosphate synthase TrpC/phosphoribosylanthranilate isomerase TrpF [Persicimonas caeni]QED33886.1 bifunctional indole-3-glycerol-phosphate synthase TrpC/phosphoribosylanthranilate isomerase TrpF [Persicimonas caeni]
MALEDLVNQTRTALEQRAQDRDVSAHARQQRPSNRSLADALAGDRLGYILECEQALAFGEQSTGEIDPAALARTFAPFAQAVAISFREGRFEQNRQKVRAIRDVVDLPVVCDDVVVEPYQVHEAREFGADAITLMPAVVTPAVFDECVSAARSVNLDVVGVVRNSDDLDQVLDAGISLVGIDNRNFDDMSFDLGHTRELAPKVPDDCTVISLGGFDDHRQIVALRAHFDAVLTGGSLVDSGDVPRALRELIFGRVKVCGLAHPADARAAWQAGATHGGLIFAPGSARHVNYDAARVICAAAPLEFVGVFVDDSMDEIACCAERLSMSAVQLHGRESNDYILELRRRIPRKTEIWKAVHVDGKLPNLSSIHADRILLDNFERGRAGKSAIFDWSLLGELDARSRDRILLGGGLTPDNAARADDFGTWALDVNLGVESSTGTKSRALLDQFFAALRR